MENTRMVAQIRALRDENSARGMDLLPLIKEERLYNEIVSWLAQPFRAKVDAVVSPEAKGWLLGISMARELQASFIPVRKADAPLYEDELLISESYITHSGEESILQMISHSLPQGSRVLIVDEWVRSGNTVQCCLDLLAKVECSILGIATISIAENDKTKPWIDNGLVYFVGKDIW